MPRVWYLCMFKMRHFCLGTVRVFNAGTNCKGWNVPPIQKKLYNIQTTMGLAHLKPALVRTCTDTVQGLYILRSWLASYSQGTGSLEGTPNLQQGIAAIRAANNSNWDENLNDYCIAVACYLKFNFKCTINDSYLLLNLKQFLLEDVNHVAKTLPQYRFICQQNGLKNKH